MTEYKDALDRFEYADYQSESPCWVDAKKLLGNSTYDTIRRALRIAHELMQEPSEEMTKKAIESYNQNGKFALVSHYKAMRDQLLKEVNND